MKDDRHYLFHSKVVKPLASGAKSPPLHRSTEGAALSERSWLNGVKVTQKY